MPNTGGGFSLNHSTSKFGSQMRHWNIFITFSFVEFSKTEWNIEILWILFALRSFFGIFLDHDSFEFLKNDTEISFIDDITSWLRKVFFRFYSCTNFNEITARHKHKLHSHSDHIRDVLEIIFLFLQKFTFNLILFMAIKNKSAVSVTNRSARTRRSNWKKSGKFLLKNSRSKHWNIVQQVLKTSRSCWIWKKEWKSRQ